jgi:dTDP-4-dehydrorhamnose reductase
VILILGATGFIGSNLYAFLKRSGVNVLGTYRSKPEPGLLHFDLCRSSMDELLNGWPIRFAILSAESHKKLDDYKRFWDEAYSINVKMIKRFLDACFERNVIPIYISTDNVFDGTKGHYKEDDYRNPINCYGKIRYEVENYIFQSSQPFVILRAGKVFGLELGDSTLLTSLVDSLQKGETLKCATDQIITPVCIDDLTSFIYNICKNEYRGVYHVASLIQSTIYAMANVIKDHFHCSDAEIIPCKINSLDLLEKRPSRIQLDAAKYRHLTGAKERDLLFYLEKIKQS